MMDTLVVLFDSWITMVGKVHLRCEVVLGIVGRLNDAQRELLAEYIVLGLDVWVFSSRFTKNRRCPRSSGNLLSKRG